MAFFRSGPRDLPVSVRELKSYRNAILRQKLLSSLAQAFTEGDFSVDTCVCRYISKSFSQFRSLPVFPVICNHRLILTFSCCPCFRNAIGRTRHIHFLAKHLTAKLGTFLILNEGVKLAPQPRSFSYAVINVLPSNSKCQMC